VSGRSGLKINIKYSKLLRTGINESEEVMVGIEKINQVDSSTCLNSISKDGGYKENIKCRMAWALSMKALFFDVEMSLED